MSTTTYDLAAAVPAGRKRYPHVIGLRVADEHAAALAALAHESGVSPGVMARLLLVAALRASSEPTVSAAVAAAATADAQA